MTLTSILAFGHSLFLAFIFWNKKNGQISANRILALLLLALTIRITKSVIILVFPNVSDLAPALGLIGMAAIGPLLWLYLSVRINNTYLSVKQTSPHFFFPIFLLLISPFLGDDDMYRAYQLSIAQMVIYIGSSIFLLLKKTTAIDKQKDIITWFWLLLSSILLIWITFFLQLLAETRATYVLVTTCACCILYGLSFWGINKSSIFSKILKAKTANQNGKEEALANKILDYFEGKKIYTNPNLTISSLSDLLNVPAYQVSRVVNTNFEKSFPELLNEYRIAEASKLLNLPDYQHLSINGIAAESGFKSLSAFYTAFKKIKGMTPAEWRKKNIS